MDEDLFELAKEYDLSYDEAEEISEIMDECDVDPDVAIEIYENL